MTTINEGKRLTGYFNLNESDFQKLSKKLDWKIFIKDNGWFFISKVNAYNSGKGTLTKVDLITADEKTRLKFKRPFRPLGGNTLNTGSVINQFNKKYAHDTNIIIGEGDVSVDGKYNVITGDRVKVVGDVNTVLSNDVIIVGSINTVPVGLHGVKIMGDLTTPDRSGVYVDGIKSGYKKLTKVAANYTASIYDDVISVSASGVTITLPSSTTVDDGKEMSVKNISGGSITVTCADDIDYDKTLTLLDGDVISLESINTKWI
jgi:hypothetical protein